MKLELETTTRIELGALVWFIATAKGITYTEAEKLLPAHIFEDESCIHTELEGDWCTEVTAAMKEQDINFAHVYQD